VSTEEDLSAIKQATRELHEAIQEARQVQRELDACRQSIGDDVRALVDQQLEVHVAAGLSSYDEAIRTAIERATAAVFKRFDRIADIILGESKRQRREGSASIEELLNARYPGAGGS
jgi:hypothetical protein